MIIQLDPLTINKIAAGEVIERPASVVKELVENSIDAGSNQISIILKEGGKKLIEVIDNGSGMHYDDAKVSILRHTTSKISSADDLFSITSLGFRGEALASIVSVAQVEITTREEKSELGIFLKVEGGKISEERKISSGKGTKISVRNLFYNVPVRKKFLKTETTEMNHITEYITKLAMAYPQISFSLEHNGRSVISAPKGDLLSQITSIFGKNIAKACLPILKSDGDYKIHGFITKPEFSRKSRDYLYTFVLNRPIVNKTITDAVLQGYRTAIPHNRSPIAFIFVDLPANEVDVNVHPTKKEVRFVNENKIFSLIELSVQESLEKSGLNIFERVSETKYKPTTLHPTTKTTKETSRKSGSLSSSYVASDEEKRGFQITRTREQSIDTFLPTTGTDKQISKIEPEKQTKIKILGIIKDTYIIAETQEGLLLCDQHAAHEKINYSKYLNQLKSKKLSIQRLLAPVAIDIKPSEMDILDSIKANLLDYGFEIETFGKNEILIRTIPSIMGVIVSYELTKDMIDIFKENIDEIKNQVNHENLDFVKEIVSVFACRRSIKSGDKISISEAESLIIDLLSLKEPYTCPHGRPTMVILNEKYIEELFQRDYKS